MEIGSINREFTIAPTNLRGWILQERVLPVRRLYFFRTQLCYVCRSSEVCEVFPEEVPRRLKSECHIYDPPALWQHNDLFDNTYNMFTNWGSLAEEYSKCSLTNPSDKMIALSGLAKVFQRATHDDYVAGFWKSRLPWTLNWRGKGSRSCSALDISPTWSWLSIDGEIWSTATLFRGEHKTAICEILNVSVMPADMISKEIVASGPLNLRALSFLVYATADSSLDASLLVNSYLDDLDSLIFDPDDTYDKITPGTWLIMAILTVDARCAEFLNFDQHAMEGPTRRNIAALVLKYDELRDQYRRVGVLNITTKASESQLKYSPLLEAFGLTIKDTFGEVTVKDDSNWKFLRVV